MTTTATYWTYDIAAHENGKDRLLVSGPADTLGEAFARAFQDACYYIGIGYTVSASFSERCRACDGEGKVASKRNKWHKITCKACKGQGVLQEVPRQRLGVGEHVQIVEKARQQFRHTNYAYRIEVFEGIHGFCIMDIDTNETRGLGDFIDHLQCATGYTVGSDAFYQYLMKEVEKNGEWLRKNFFGVVPCA
jgi:hypothetical protein